MIADGRRRTPPGHPARAGLPARPRRSSAAAVTDRTRFVLLNTPHNPTGTVLTAAELDAIAEVAIEHDLVVITDEVYEHLIFDDGTSTSRWRRCRACSSAPLTLSSAGKSSRSPAGRSAGRPARPTLVGAVLAAKQWLTFTSGSPLQPAVAHALDHEPATSRARSPPTSQQAPRPALRRPGRRSASTSRVPEGTYFATTDVARSAGRTGWRSAWPCPSGPAWSRSRPRCSTTTPTRAGTWCAGRSARSASVIEEALRRLAPSCRPDRVSALTQAARRWDGAAAHGQRGRDGRHHQHELAQARRGRAGPATADARDRSGAPAHQEHAAEQQGGQHHRGDGPDDQRAADDEACRDR